MSKATLKVPLVTSCYTFTAPIYSATFHAVRQLSLVRFHTTHSPVFFRLMLIDLTPIMKEALMIFQVLSLLNASFSCSVAAFPKVISTRLLNGIGWAPWSPPFLERLGLSWQLKALEDASFHMKKIQLLRDGGCLWEEIWQRVRSRSTKPRRHWWGYDYPQDTSGGSGWQHTLSPKSHRRPLR